MHPSAVSAGAQGTGIPLNCRGVLILRNMAYPNPAAGALDQTELSLLLATGTSRKYPAPTPEWSSPTLPAGRVPDLRKCPTAKICVEHYSEDLRKGLQRRSTLLQNDPPSRSRSCVFRLYTPMHALNRDRS